MSEKLIHLTFKNPDLEKNPDAKKWKDKMETLMNSEENIKNFEEATIDAMLYGVGFATQNLENKMSNKIRLDPKEVFKVQKPEPDAAFIRSLLIPTRQSFEDNFLQKPRPLKEGDRVQLRYGSKNVIWILKELYPDGTALVEGVIERKEGVVKKIINLIEITEWTQN